MNRIFRILICAMAVAVAALGHAQPAKAQSAPKNDFGIWSFINIVKPWDNGAYAMLRVETRTMDNSAQRECSFVSAGGGYKLADWLKADMSYEYWQRPGTGTDTQKLIFVANETLRKGDWAFTLREKYEICSNIPNNTNGADWNLTNTIRLRGRVQYGMEIGKVPVTEYMMLEEFLNLDQMKWARQLFYVGTSVGITANVALDMFYLNYIWDATQAGVSDIGSRHLLGLGLALTL